MKRTFTINLNNIVFHIDDDAYELLQSYLESVGEHFASESEHNDIMADIEARIAELFSEKMDNLKNVITIEDVNDIIKIMGKPSQFAEESGGEKADDETVIEEDPISRKEKSYKKLYRDIDKRLIGGVAAGLANYSTINVTIIRVIFIVLLFISSFTFPLIYILMWIIIPKAVTTSQKMEMHGEDINIETIKNKMLDAKDYLESDHFRVSANNFGTQFVKIVFGFVKILFALIGGIISLAGVILIAALIFGLIIFLLEPNAIISLFPEFFSVFGTTSPDKVILLLTSLILLIGSPVFALIYWSLNIISDKRSRRSHTGLWVALLLWLAGLFMFIATGSETLKKFSRDYNLFNQEKIEAGSNEIQDNMNFQTEERTVTPFFAIDASSAVDIEITQQPEQYVRINTLEDFLPYVKSDVVNGELKIYIANKLISPRVKIEIGVDSLESITLSGASKLYFENDFHLKNLNIELSGASVADLRLNSAQKLDVSLSGASKLSSRGEADSLIVDCSGASKLATREMEAEYAEIKLSGASNADVHASKTFKGNASGASKINCYGKPEYRVQKNTGSSTINFN